MFSSMMDMYRRARERKNWRSNYSHCSRNDTHWRRIKTWPDFSRVAPFWIYWSYLSTVYRLCLRTPMRSFERLVWTCRQVNREIEVTADRIYHRNPRIWCFCDSSRNRHLREGQRTIDRQTVWEISPLHLAFRQDLAAFKYSTRLFGRDWSL